MGPPSVFKQRNVVTEESGEMPHQHHLQCTVIYKLLPHPFSYLIPQMSVTWITVPSFSKSGS